MTLWTLPLAEAVTLSDTLVSVGEKILTAILGGVITLGGIWLKNRSSLTKVHLQHELDKDKAEDEEASRIRDELRADLNAVRQHMQELQNKLSTIQQELDNERRIKLHLLEQIMFLQARSRLMQTNSENILTWLKASNVEVPPSLVVPVPATPVIADNDSSLNG